MTLLIVYILTLFSFKNATSIQQFSSIIFIIIEKILSMKEIKTD